MDQVTAGINTLNSPGASTVEKLAAIDAMNEEGYTWAYTPENGTYEAVTFEEKQALLMAD